MKKSKIVAACLASSLLAVSMALPSSAAKSSFTPDNTNFTPVFDFDSTPTAKYTDGYNPGVRSDLIGDSKTQKCITADGVGYSYNLSIIGNGGYSGKALKLDVNENSPEDGIYCPIGLHSEYGENKNSGVPSGYTATDLCFWVDCTGFKDSVATSKGETPLKGILLYFQEKDYDQAGNQVKDPTAWWPKTTNEGGYWQIEDGNGSWKKMDMNSTKRDHDFFIPNTYKGWVKIPLSNFELVSGGSWNQNDQDGKIDAKSVEQISLGMGNYAKQAGSTVIFDQFGFMMQSNTPPTTTTTENITITTTQNTIATTTGNTITTTSGDATTSVSGNVTTTGSVDTDTTAGGSTTTANEATASNPKTGYIPSTFGVIAVVSAGIVFAVRRKKK